MVGFKFVLPGYNGQVLQNPFSGGEFYYLGKRYTCKNKRIQLALYIFIYGVLRNYRITSLFNLFYKGKLIDFPYFSLFHIMSYNINRKIIVYSPLTKFLNELREDISLYNNRNYDIIPFIMSRYNWIFKLLRKTYPDIKIFIYK